jgi:hypothetical protein
MRFATNSAARKLTPVTLPPGRAILATRPSATGSSEIPRLGGDCARVAHDDHHADLATHQIGYEFWKAIEPAFRPAIFDGDVATLDITGLRQSLAQGGKAAPHRIAGRRGAEIADNWHRRLLRARRDRPRRRAAEQRDELAACHSITSSAMVRSPGGTSMPSARAV